MGDLGTLARPSCSFKLATSNPTRTSLILVPNLNEHEGRANVPVPGLRLVAARAWQVRSGRAHYSAEAPKPRTMGATRQLMLLKCHLSNPG